MGGNPTPAAAFSFNSNGSFSYTPPMGYSGTVTFQYKAIHTASGAQSNTATVTIEVFGMMMPLEFAGEVGSGGGPEVSARELAALSQAAAQRWREAGVEDDVLREALSGVRLVIADIPGTGLGGVTDDGRMVVDLDGAGHGWFIDATPGSNSEFTRWTSESQGHAGANSPASGLVDLLTVVEHEIGHLLGLDHAEGDIGNVMQDTLGLGTRRVPTALDAALVDLYFTDLGSGRRRR